MAKNAIPDWALRHKTKGTSVHCIRGKYYLYKISSKWDSKKGRAVKKTDGYLGRITEGGFISPKIKSIVSDLKNVTIKSSPPPNRSKLRRMLAPTGARGARQGLLCATLEFMQT